MRQTPRQPVKCGGCNASIYWLSTTLPPTGPDIVDAQTREPPAATESCPRCGGQVDTTNAYPVLPDYPPAFDALKDTWRGFKPYFEFNRPLPEDDLAESEFTKLSDEINTPDGMDWLRQRLFYRSATCFYRSFELLLATLSLEGRAYKSWSDVTAYYSRFYSIQSILNLLLTSFFRHPAGEILIYFTGTEACVLKQNNFPPPMRNSRASHERWWLLMETIKVPSDYPGNYLDFVLSRAYYEPTQRNTINYDFDYVWGGFPELNWFDQDVRGMMAHFNPSVRQDKDVTDEDRFFAGDDPEWVDLGDFRGDPIQVVWLSLCTVLELITALGIEQSFISTPKIAALAEVHLYRDFPKITEGLVRETSRLLVDNYDVDAHIQRLRAAGGYTFFDR